jgi:hypothetical protein
MLANMAISYSSKVTDNMNFEDRAVHILANGPSATMTGGYSICRKIVATSGCCYGKCTPPIVSKREMVLPGADHGLRELGQAS